MIVSGVPGAGKTTAIAHATEDLDQVTALDPEHVSGWLRRRLPTGLPYPAYRWSVHLVHLLRVLGHLRAGPTADQTLVVHDPGTRPLRRRVLLATAHLAGWRTIMVYIDIDRQAAQHGQFQRGRIVRSFDHHWRRWRQLRSVLLAAAGAPMTPGFGDVPVLLLERAKTAEVLSDLCSPGDGCSPDDHPQPAHGETTLDVYDLYAVDGDGGAAGGLRRTRPSAIGT